MRPAFGYVRVSAREQGRSGLGLAAQRHDLHTRYLRSEANTLVFKVWGMSLIAR